MDGSGKGMAYIGEHLLRYHVRVFPVARQVGSMCSNWESNLAMEQAGGAQARDPAVVRLKCLADLEGHRNANAYRPPCPAFSFICVKTMYLLVGGQCA